VSGVDGPADVLIEAGRVSAVGPSLSAAGADVYDISGAVICPGLVDMHAHLREPGREDEETIASGSAAAVAGGFTALCAMPNTDPVCDNAAVAEMVAAEGLRVGLAEVLPAGAITVGQQGERMAPIGEMAASTARVRFFTDDGRGVQDARMLRRAMEYIKGWGGVCAEHCEEFSLSEGGQMNEGELSDLLGLQGIPAEAEEIALARDLALARLTGVRFHAMHVSTAGSVELIRSARLAGVAVTAEATPHHLSLTEAELESFDPLYKVNPPLRRPKDVRAVREGLVEGIIDAVATDHAPHAQEEKEGEIDSAPPGMIGLETALGVVLTELFHGDGISLSSVVDLMSVKPAKILGLPAQGGPIVEGSPANLTVFDPEADWIVDAGAFMSTSRNSPWNGKSLKGRCIHTISLGRHVFDQGFIRDRSVV